MFYSGPFWLLWAVVAVVALARVRRVAMAGALVMSATQLGALVWFDHQSRGMSAAPVVVGLVAAVALGFGPGVGRGGKPLGRGGLAGAVVFAVTVGAIGSARMRMEVNINWGEGGMLLIVAAMVFGAWLIRSAAGRRAAILLAVPLYPALMAFYPVNIEDMPSRILVTVIAIPVAVFVTAVSMIMVFERLVLRPACASERSAAGSRTD